MITPRNARSFLSLGFLLGSLSLGSNAFAIETSIYGSMDAVYKVSGSSSNGTYNYQGFNRTLSTTQSDGFTYFLNGSGDNPFHFSGSVYSAGDGAGAHVSSSIRASHGAPDGPPGSDGYFSPRTSAQAIVTYTDLIVSGPGTSPIQTSYSAVVHGSMSATAEGYTNGSVGGVSASSALATVLYAKNLPGAQSYFQQEQVSGSDPTTGGFGQLTGFDGSATLTSDLFEVTPGVPFSSGFLLGVSTSSGFNDDGAGSVLALANFSNSLTFVTGRPVFDLPVGYTVNSVSAHIVNNFYVAPVPEPATMAALGVAMLAELRRRKKA